MLTSMLDTNICIRAMRKDGEAVRARLQQELDWLCLSTMVLHELYLGAALSARPEFHRALVGELASRLPVIDFDDDAAFHAADIRADLQKRGALIGANDMLIAGHARSLGLKLITSDLSDFGRVSGLISEDWTTEEKP